MCFTSVFGLRCTRMGYKPGWLLIDGFVLSDLVMSIFLCRSGYSTDAQSPPLLRILEACIWRESLACTSCGTHSRCWRHRVRFPRLQVVMGGNVVICGYGVCWAAFCSCTKAPHVNTAARVRKSKLFGFFFHSVCQNMKNVNLSRIILRNVTCNQK